MKDLKITCVSENTSSFNRSRFLASHGQSLLVELDEKKYLFDVGPSYEAFTYNLKSLDLQIEQISSVILSHNHLDHSGALFELVDELDNQKLLLPPDMLSIHDEEGYRLSFNPDDKEAAIQKLIDYKHASVIDDGGQIEDNVYSTGTLDSADDRWPDKEQALVMVIPNKGLLILAACSHPTISIIVENARKVTGVQKVYGIIGGLHYARLDEDELMKNILYLQSLDFEFIVPSHCTGYRATTLMQEILKDKVRCSSIGAQFGGGNSVTILPELTFDLS